MLGGSASPAAVGPLGRAGDAELIRLASAGNADAFDVLLRPRLDRLFRMAMAITRSEQDARDATQNSCVLAWRELPSLRDPARFDAWISQILVNAARGLVRRAGRVSVRELSLDVEPTAGGPARPEPAQAGEAETFADSEAIRRAFDRLDGTTRALLVMHYVEGQPLADIARTVGAPVGTIKWRLSNARRALERALKVEQR